MAEIEYQEAELWNAQSISAQARFMAEQEHLASANRFATEFSAEANEYIMQLAEQVENTERSLSVETEIAERRGRDFDRAQRRVQALESEMAAPSRMPLPRQALSVGVSPLTPRPASVAPIASAQSQAQTQPASMGFDRRVISALTAHGYRIGVTPQQQQQQQRQRQSQQQPAVFSIDSDSENEDEAFQRRRTAVKELKLEPLPTSHGLRKWTNDLITESCRCSNRSKARTLKYVQEVFNATDVTQLEAIPSRWDAFDTELASALLKSASGAVAREIQLYQEQCNRELRPFGGRPVLYMILKRYELNYGQALQVDIAALQALTFKGDLEGYLDALDSRLAIMVQEPDQALLLSIVEPELRKCSELSLDFQLFDRAQSGSHDGDFEVLV